MPRASTSSRRAVPGVRLLVGEQQGDPGVVPVPAPEERQPVHMVPVQVGEQDGAVNGRPASSPVTWRSPVPASRMSAGAGLSSWQSATHEVCPP